MNGPYLTFMLVPCGAAICIGWAVRHWALAVAAIAGGLGFAFLLGAIQTPLSKFLFPMASSAMIAGIVLLLMLLWRPTVSVWNRMGAALIVVFMTHLVFLQYALAGS